MSVTVRALSTKDPPPQVVTNHPVVFVWVTSGYQINVVTSYSLVIVRGDKKHSETDLGGKVLTCCLHSDNLVVLLQVDTRLEIRKIHDDRDTVVVASISDFQYLRNPWLGVFSGHQLNKSFYNQFPSLQADGDISVIGWEERVIVTDGRNVLSSDSLAMRTKLAFHMKYLNMVRSEKTPSLVNFRSLSCLLTKNSGVVDCKFLVDEVIEILVKEEKILLLTSSGQLWKVNERSQTQQMLSHVKSIALVDSTLTVLTEDTTVYTFDIREDRQRKLFNIFQNQKSQASETSNEILKSSDQLRKIGSECQVARTKLEQLRILHYLQETDHQSFICKFEIVSNSSQERIIKLELTNISPHTFLSTYWNVRLDITSNCSSHSIPSIFPPQDKLELLLTLPICHDLPVHLQGRLVFQGEGTEMIPTPTVFKEKIGLLQLLTLSSISSSSLVKETDLSVGRQKFLTTLSVRSLCKLEHIEIEVDCCKPAGKISSILSKMEGTHHMYSFQGDRIGVEVVRTNKEKVKLKLSSTNGKLLKMMVNEIV